MDLKTSLNQALSVGVIRGIISGGISVKDFTVVTNNSEEDARVILKELMDNGIGTKSNEVYYFSEGDKLKAALYLLKQGVPLEDVSEVLDWRDFEGLAAEILESKDFATMRNFVMTKPRREIDVIGIKRGVALVIDCKHWKKPVSSLYDVVQRQIERTKQYISSTPGAMAIPVIVTLYQEKVEFIRQVPIVPIFQLPSFVDEFYGNLEQLETIRTD